MSESRKDLARELYESRNDPEEWSEEAEEIEVKPRRSSVVSFRLPPEELDALEQAMEQTGETLSEYVRTALALRIHGGAAMPTLGTLGITYGAYSGLTESDPGYESLLSHVTKGFGLSVVEGNVTAASLGLKGSHDEHSMRMLAMD